jgi:hypothetical protein
VEALPRDQVAKFLEKTDANAAVGYLEHVIHALGEKGADFHDKLAELYLARARAAKDPGEHESLVTLRYPSEDTEAAYDRFTDFLGSSTHYRPYRLLNRLPGDGEGWSSCLRAES